MKRFTSQPDSSGSNNLTNQHPLEHFVDADIAAEYLHCSRKHILRLSRLGLIPAHPISFGQRVTWRYLLSELRAWVLSNRAPVNVAGNGASGRRWLAAAPAKEAVNGIPAGEFEKSKKEEGLTWVLRYRIKGADRRQW